MDKKAKLYVFAKKEVALIFVFMILIACTSFTLGIKVGKEHAYQKAGIQKEDRERVELLSLEEESLKDIDDKEDLDPNRSVKEDMIHARLEKEIKKQIDEAKSGEKEDTRTNLPPKKETIRDILREESQNISDDTTSAASPKKGHTIQLAAYRSKKEADEFAQGFVIRGYTPFIREVEIPGKGTWFRVVLGEFSTIEEAKEYIAQEKSLFQGEDYMIRPLD